MPQTRAPEAHHPAAVPLVILTGFLGAGKTTVLNRVLGAQHHRRVAVLVNELGRIDVDAALIRGRAGDVLELTGGCVCHQIGVQRELISALGDVMRRSRPDVVVLETTGIAEPAAILEALNPPDDADLADDSDSDSDSDSDTYAVAAPRAGGADPRARPDVVFAPVSVVTVVDAVVGQRQLERHPEAREQVVAADRILISKLDQGGADTLGGLHRRLHELNARAERAAFPSHGGGTAALIPWLLDTPPLPEHARRRPSKSSRARGHLDAHPHAHPHQLAAATYVDDAPLIADALLLACQSLGDALVRVKGFVHLAGQDHRGFLERAGDKTELTLGPLWGDDARLTRLVLIGEDLDEGALHRRLWACRAPLP